MQCRWLHLAQYVCSGGIREATPWPVCFQWVVPYTQQVNIIIRVGVGGGDLN